MNSIRTPKQGTNATSRRIAEAVDDEEWQKFRLSLKGLSTRTKLYQLREYYDEDREPRELEDVVIRVDNYLKALARGGQIETSTNYVSDLVTNQLVIRR